MKEREKSEKMAKVYVQTQLSSPSSDNDYFEGKALLKENRIVYYQDSLKNVFTMGELVTLIREDDEKKLELCFYPEPKVICHLKEYNQSLLFDIKVDQLVQQEMNYEIDYQIEKEKYHLKIKIEVIENDK